MGKKIILNRWRKKAIYFSTLLWNDRKILMEREKQLILLVRNVSSPDSYRDGSEHYFDRVGVSR